MQHKRNTNQDNTGQTEAWNNSDEDMYTPTESGDITGEKGGEASAETPIGGTQNVVGEDMDGGGVGQHPNSGGNPPGRNG